jgi:hypothetical protein
MCDKELKLEVGKLYLDNCGRVVRPVFVSKDKETTWPVLCVVSPDSEGGPEHETWYSSNGKICCRAALYKQDYRIVREKPPTKTFRYKRYLWRNSDVDCALGMHRENGMSPNQHTFVKWIDEDWQTIEVEV